MSWINKLKSAIENVGCWTFEMDEESDFIAIRGQNLLGQPCLMVKATSLEEAVEGIEQFSLDYDPVVETLNFLDENTDPVAYTHSSVMQKLIKEVEPKIEALALAARSVC